MRTKTVFTFVTILVIHLSIFQSTRAFPIIQSIFGTNSINNVNGEAQVNKVTPVKNTKKIFNDYVENNVTPVKNEPIGKVTQLKNEALGKVTRLQNEKLGKLPRLQNEQLGSKVIQAKNEALSKIESIDSEEGISNNLDGVIRQVSDSKSLKEIDRTTASIGEHSIGFITNLLGQGVEGLRDVVTGSKNFAKKTINDLRDVKNKAFDSMHRVVDKGAESTLKRVDNLTQKMNMYKTALSGISKKKEGENKGGHSITITTKADAPIKTLTEFYNQYVPQGSSSSSLPELTDIDFSNFF